MVDQDHSSKKSDDARVSRRQILALTSGAAVTGLAGCLGGGGEEDLNTPTGAGDGTATESTATEGGASAATGTTAGNGGDTGTAATDDDTTSVTTPSGDPVTTEIAHRAPVSWQPSNSNVNPFAQPGNKQFWMDYMWWDGVAYPAGGPYLGEAATFILNEAEFQSNGCEVLLHLEEGHTWWDGSEVTARDYLTLRELNSYQTYGPRSEWEVGLELVDDYTIREIHPAPRNPQSHLLGLLSTVSTKHSYWKSWLQQYEDASGQDAMNSITTDLTETRVSMQELVDEGLGNGFWIPEQWSPTEVVHKKHEGHPRAGWTNLDTDRWILMAENQKAIQAFNNDQFDIGESVLTQVNQGSNQNVEKFQNFPQGGIPKLAINQSNKHLARPAVRQAISYLIDYEELRAAIASAHGTNYLEHPHKVGMAAPLAESYLGEEFLGNIIDYGTTAKTDQASQVLKDAGYSQEGGNWVGPDGDAIKGLTYITPPWAIYKTTAQYLSPKLNDFGIGNNVQFPSGTSFYASWQDDFDFDLCNWFANGNHPSTVYSTASASGIDNFVGGVGSISGIIANRTSPDGCSVNRSPPEYSAERTERLNIPVNDEFPQEVGATTTDGGSQQLKPITWSNVMSQSQSEDEVKEIARKIAWWHNWSRPHIGFYEEKWTYWGDTTNYNMPSTDGHQHPEAEETAPGHYVGFFENLTRGHVTAKTE